MEITIVEKNGWKKSVTLEKTVTKIGRAPFSDIQLASVNILPIHIQLIYAQEDSASCTIVNFGPAFSCFSDSTETRVETGAALTVRDSDEIVLEEYRIQFHLPFSTELLASSQQIAATLSLADTVMRPGAPLIATLRLKNLGSNPACVFQMTMDGLPDSCFQVDPLPMLYPGADEDVRIRFFHRGMVPPAGTQTVTIVVTAPASYPGEQVIIQQSLYVAPLLLVNFKLADDMPVTAKVEAPLPMPVPETPAPASSIAPAEEASLQGSNPTFSAPPIEMEVTVEEKEEKIEAIPVAIPEPALPPAPAQKDVSSAKVARKPSETYWNE